MAFYCSYNRVNSVQVSFQTKMCLISNLKVRYFNFQRISTLCNELLLCKWLLLLYRFNICVQSVVLYVLFSIQAHPVFFRSRGLNVKAVMSCNQSCSSFNCRTPLKITKSSISIEHYFI